MYIYKIILVLALLSLLFLGAQRAIADPVEIIKIVEVQTLPDIKVYAFEKVLERWGDSQWFYFNDLIARESKWSSTAKNPTSSAYGLCQTMMSAHKTPAGFRKNPYMQIDWCIDYVATRYKTPKQAISFWDRNQWF